ncbi:uncharacterized protein MELLADRAFT_90026 [Melampsora larici-populina 98AG31]|uniref:Uncharacterized protein n=1 Tax=Melampsora larici-populina (strain 98AG31 / pathotype 3-4-7) TaxID=747676 RepID=F4RVG6_MELLP|nr:uncharacterized protein MELLADRAFT_90026 [Melampsora larici-populina 98AG31]EGG03673.1 hypothetical protein MELLADRAFT_90026 [Melampsora larici-populina 98AG31]
MSQTRSSCRSAKAGVACQIYICNNPGSIQRQTVATVVATGFCPRCEHHVRLRLRPGPGPGRPGLPDLFTSRGRALAEASETYTTGGLWVVRWSHHGRGVKRPLRRRGFSPGHACASREAVSPLGRSEQYAPPRARLHLAPGAYLGGPVLTTPSFSLGPVEGPLPASPSPPLPASETRAIGSGSQRTPHKSRSHARYRSTSHLIREPTSAEAGSGRHTKAEHRTQDTARSLRDEIPYALPLTMTQPSQPNSYFELMSTDPSNPQWKCLVCVRHMRTYGPHSKSKAHLEAVAQYEARLAGDHEMIPGLNEDGHSANHTATPQDNPIGLELDEDGPRSDTSDRPPSPLPCLRAFRLAEANQPSDSETSNVDEMDLEKLLLAINAMDADEGGPQDPERDEALLEADLRNTPFQESSAWYPFKKKEPAGVGGFTSVEYPPEEEPWPSRL